MQNELVKLVKVVRKRKYYKIFLIRGSTIKELYIFTYATTPE